MIKTLTGVKTTVLAGAAAALIAGGVVLSDQAEAQAPRLMTPPIGIEGQLSFADLVEQVSPAVVSIHTEQTIERPEIPREFERFFNAPGAPRFEVPRGTRPQLAQAEGSGFFIDAEGHIVTNNHVIDDAEKITVRLTDGTELEATLIGTDPGTDLAVLKVEAQRGQRYVRFTEDANLRVGDWVLAVGNPFGLGGTVTSGIVSAIGRDNNFGNYNDFIQIDASINRGNSGGPTFDLNGRVVGVNTAIYSPTGGSVGIGFAIPADTASYVVQQLIDRGRVSRGWLGVQIRPFDNTHAAAVGLENSKGALVNDVYPDTPAEKGGMKAGDIVLKIDGKEVEDARALTRAIGAVEPGNTVNLLVYRDGKNQSLRVKLDERDEAALAGSVEENAPANDNLTNDLGASFSSLSNNDKAELGLPTETEGVLVSGVLPNSVAADAGLAPGMVILQADSKKVRTPSDLEDLIEDAKESGKEAILLRVQAGESKDFRALSLEDLSD
jgi:serine protease Do